MAGVSMPGAFPEAEETAAVPRTPKRKFVGRRTFEAKQRQGDVGSVEETTAIVQSGEMVMKKQGADLIFFSTSTNTPSPEPDPE